MKKISVVIPYFQRKSGILIKAVQSALDQHAIADLEILIVDDASPVSAASELTALPADQRRKIRVIEQSNAGPAAARNKALDSVSKDTEYVAFLDSDDVWTPQHLANALTALDQGFDFYFTDHFQLSQTVSAFNRAKRIQVEQHPKISGAEQLRAYQGDMFDQILMGNIIGTSTVVYRFARFPLLRFREEFVYAGEDYLFWLEIAKATNRIVFSSLCECTYGEGVNIFAGSGWGTEKSLTRLHYEMKYKKAIGRLFELTDGQAQHNRQAIRALRKSFVMDVLHRARQRKGMDHVLMKQLRVDIQTYIYFIPLALRVLARR